MTDDRETVLIVNNAYTVTRKKTVMRSNEKNQVPKSADDFEDISVVKNLLELQSRLRTRTDSIETQSD